MTTESLIVIGVIITGMVLFATERLPVDVTALLIMVVFMLTGVLTPVEGLAGFSNSATLTVAFMFVISHALLKTGSLQRIGPWLGDLFKKNYTLGLLATIVFVGSASAFVNNTPIVAMFIPVMISVGYYARISATKLLIPLSYASIFGGMCTMIGTSTNMLVSGIAVAHGLEPFPIFLSAPIGFVLLIAGTIYMYLFGKRLLPDRKITSQFDTQNVLRDYITEIELLSGSGLVGQTIMDSVFNQELEVDIIQVRRGDTVFDVPTGDFQFEQGDVLKIRCDVSKIKEMKDRLRVEFTESKIKLRDGEMPSGKTTMIELIVKNGSEFEGKTLRSLDFRRMYRAAPLAIIHRKELVQQNLHDVRLSAGDVILTEVKSHWVKNLRKSEMNRNSPFIILTEQGIIDFDRKSFLTVLSVIVGVVGLAAFGILPIVTSVILGTVLLILFGTISINELYQSIEWKIIFLLAGALSIGAAMVKTGLSDQIASLIVERAGGYGPVAIIAALYLLTSLLTEVMSNNATAAIFAPIAIGISQVMNIDATPLLLTVMIAASASFLTPIGYQTNTMVYAAGQYRFGEFFKVGALLNLLFWLLVCLLIPVFYPF